jgi:hypothetical protein
MSSPADKKNRRKRPTKAQEEEGGGPSLDERLTALYSSTGVIGVRARQQMEDPAIKILDDYELQRSARATEKRKENAQAHTLWTAAIIEDEFYNLRERLPNYDFRKDPLEEIGQRLQAAVEQRRKQEKLRPYKLKAATIGRYLAKLRYFSGGGNELTLKTDSH